MNTAHAKSKSYLEDITIIKENGRKIKLGRPGTLRFKIRVWLYKNNYIGGNNG